MSGQADDSDGMDGRSGLAAEFALGLLEGAERRKAERLVAEDPAFAADVAVWRARLAPLDDAYAPAVPPASVKAALDARLFPGSARVEGRWWNSLSFWRGWAAAASIAAIAAVMLLPLPRGDAGPETSSLVAELVPQAGSAGFNARLDVRAGTIELTPVVLAASAGQSLELWVIAGDAPPVSLGLVPVGGGLLRLGQAQGLVEGATLAVSLEPEGGSPTGQPTGPVVMAGIVRTR